MKIVIIVNNFPPVIDGVGDYSYFLAKQLTKQQNHVCVICSTNVPSGNAHGIEIFPVVNTWNKNGFQEVVRVIEDLAPDYVLLQYVPHAYSKYGVPFGLYSFLKAINNKKIPFAVIYHEVWIRLSFKKISHFLIALCQRLIAYRITRAADTTITSIDSYAALLQRLSHKPVHQILIPPNFDTDFIPDKDEISSLKKRIGAGKKILAVFGVRDDQMVKSIFNKVQSLYPQTILLVCGKHKFECISEKDKSIYFTGPLTSEEIPLYISCGDVFLAADPVYNMEGGTSNKSGSLAAALFLGIPVVGTKGDMNNAVLKKNSGVFLENIDTIVTRIVELLMYTKEPQTNNAWKELLTWANVAKEYISIIEGRIK